MKKLSHYLILLALVLSNIFAAIPSDVFAGANDFSFKKFDADYYLTKKSDDTSVMEVTETLVAEFPNYNQNHGIERRLSFLNQNDTNLTMENTDKLEISVTRNGSPEPYTVTANNDNFLVRIGNPDVYVQGEQTYVLKYKYVHVITEFEHSAYAENAYQELYWDSNGTKWDQKFGEVNVNLRMDREIYNNLKTTSSISKTSSYQNKDIIHENNTTKNKLAAWCYVGKYGTSNQDRCKITDIDNGINFNAKNLSGRENLTFVTNFNDKTFKVPKNDYIKEFNLKDAVFDLYLSKNPDGTSKLKVKEKIVALFPTTNVSTGLTRHYAFTNQNKTKFITDNQDTFDVKIKQDGKTLDSNDVHIIKNTYNDGYFSVETGNYSDFVHGEHTFELEYEFNDIVSKNKDHDKKTMQHLAFTPLDKFYYDANMITVNLHLDDELMSNLEEYYYGKDKSFEAFCDDESSSDITRMACITTKTSDGFVFIKSNLASSDDFTIETFFKDGTFKILDDNHNYLYYHIFVIVSIILTGIAIFSYKRSYGKVKEKVNYLKNLPVAPQYQPLKDLTAGQAGKLYVRHSKNTKVATMLELIVGKKISLKKGEKKLFGGYNWSGEVTDLSGISDEQRDVLKILNGGNNLDHIGDKFDVKHRSYSVSLENAFQNYDKHIEHTLESLGYFEKPDKKKKQSPADSFFAFVGKIVLIFVGFNVAVLLLAIFGWLYISMTNFTQYSIFEGSWTIPIMIVAAFIVFLIVPFFAGVSGKYKKRTMKGLEVTRYLDGLKLYIKMAEKDRLEFLQSVKNVDTSEEGIVKLNEKLLPYAALFGLEKSWMDELEKYYELHEEAKPDWYMTGFTYSVLRDVSGTTMSRPVDTSSSSGGGFSSSSGSSGGGGGGFSGGGGGGGGGGGW